MTAERDPLLEYICSKLEEFSARLDAMDARMDKIEQSAKAHRNNVYHVLSGP